MFNDLIYTLYLRLAKFKSIATVSEQTDECTKELASYRIVIKARSTGADHQAIAIYSYLTYFENSYAWQ